MVGSAGSNQCQTGSTDCEGHFDFVRNLLACGHRYALDGVVAHAVQIPDRDIGLGVPVGVGSSAGELMVSGIKVSQDGFALKQLHHPKSLDRGDYPSPRRADSRCHTRPLELN